MWLITRPFVYVTKLITKLLGAPMKTRRGMQRRADHKTVKNLAKNQKV
jgi:hypothetical protein